MGNRLVSYAGDIPGIDLSDRVQLAAKLEHFLGKLPANPCKILLKKLPYITQNSLNPLIHEFSAEALPISLFQKPAHMYQGVVSRSAEGTSHTEDTLRATRNLQMSNVTR